MVKSRQLQFGYITRTCTPKSSKRRERFPILTTFSTYILKSSGIKFLLHISILYCITGGKVQILLEKVSSHLFQELWYSKMLLDPKHRHELYIPKFDSSKLKKKKITVIWYLLKKAQYFRNLSRRHSQDNFKQLPSRKRTAFNKHIEDTDTG